MLERLRLRGGMVNPLLQPYLADGGRQWFIWGGRPQRLPPFTPGQGRPTFATAAPRATSTPSAPSPPRPPGRSIGTTSTRSGAGDRSRPQPRHDVDPHHDLQWRRRDRRPRWTSLGSRSSSDPSVGRGRSRRRTDRRIRPLRVVPIAAPRATAPGGRLARHPVPALPVHGHVPSRRPRGGQLLPPPLSQRHHPPGRRRGTHRHPRSPGP